MSMKKFDEICKYLEDKGFVQVSIKGATKRIVFNKADGLSVVIEKDEDQMSAADEELVKDRLRQLWYMV